LRLATILQNGEEVPAVVVPGSAVPLGGIRDPDGDGWPADLLSLLESGRLDELRSHVDGLGEACVEELSARSIPHGEVEHGPLYRRPRRSGA
jgi:hypothetical protein